ncbi:Hypothetical protein CINCED_3A009486 [Cinara cedri]|uniref:Coiled-coil domain-containing protein lobo n=1 Tax=Cinara cedri TaxID=506608 RepID=A0A5E4M070_9HEMI|nr:Hypothetical protein CINCED_3A009486 [Cinara cedri]
MTDPDSLDWIWEDVRDSSEPRGTAAAAGESDGDVGDSESRDRCAGDGDGGSDTGSGSSVGCSLLTGDENPVRKLLDGVEKRSGGDGGGNDRTEKRGPTIIHVDGPGHEPGDCESDIIDTVYAGALAVAESELSEVRRLWTDALYACTVNGKNVPESYTKTTSIEKLVLLYADKFAERFTAKYPDRRLVLLHENECGVQKCVCTTIKPSRLVYHDLNDLKSYSEFVAKHITYVRLQEPMAVPKKLVSPTTTLKIKIANCFELATLLVSFLIGCEYNAFVVQGYAAETVCNNDLRKIKLDLPKDNLDNEHCESNHSETSENSESKPTFDLCSEYVKFLIDGEKKKTVVRNEVKENDLDGSSDPLYGKRVHCWVLIMTMPTGIKDENSTDGSCYFIEPSTGERQHISNKNYVGIESIWNHKNYWVNLQPSDGGCAYNFTLTNTKCWECFLPDEPQRLQKAATSQDLLRHNGNEINRPITMPNSWVNVLEVPRNEYLMLYPTGKKIVPFMNAVKEYYADYAMPDGLIEKTTFYAEPDFDNKTFVKEVYKHRIDKLIGVEIKYGAEKFETTEYFNSGRKDCLKVHKFRGDGNSLETERSITFYNLRLDSMTELNIDSNSFTTLFKDRSDLLFWRTCTFHKTEESRHLIIKRKPKNIVEKYLRDESKHKDRDIATRQFDFVANEIYVQYQYGEGQITQSSRLFIKPSDSTSADKFDPKSVIENIVYPYEGHLKPYEAYLLLQDMIKAENEALHDISKLEDSVIKILEIRSHERSEFKLKIDSLDWDRNHRIRKLLQNEKDKKLSLAKQDNVKQTEYALTYFDTVKKQSFTYDTALNVRDKILNDFRRNTKNKFMRTKQLFMEKKFQFESVMAKAMEMNNDADEFELKNKILILCSFLKYKLEVLMLKMQRYSETHVQRYDNLASYLNSSPDFEMLPPLKLINSKD